MSGQSMAGKKAKDAMMMMKKSGSAMPYKKTAKTMTKKKK